MKHPKTTIVLLVLWFMVSCSDSKDRIADKSENSTAGEGNPAVVHLNRILIPEVNISDATPEEAFDFVRQSLMANDKESDAKLRGISMIISGPKHQGNIDPDDSIGLPGSNKENVSRISFSARNVAYFDLVAEVARQARMDAYLTSVGIMIIPEGASPFPNSKAAEGEIWKAIRHTRKP